ncbi:MAG: DUF971 domain-containing protein [Pseudomonadota bacterium]
MTETTPWPTEIRLKADRKALQVTFDDGTDVTLSAEYLRVLSPSAEVKGHGPADRKTMFGKRHVEILKVEPVGNYAIRLTFDDLHDTGIYSWIYLRELGDEREARWAAYLAEIHEKGLSRDP